MDVGITRRTKDLYKLGCGCENEVPAIERHRKREERREKRKKERREKRKKERKRERMRNRKRA